MNTTYVHSWKVVSAGLVVIFLGIVLLVLLPFVVNVFEKQTALGSQNERIALMGNWKEQLTDLEYKQATLEDRLKEMVVDLERDGSLSSSIEQLFMEAKSSFVGIQKIQPLTEVKEGLYSKRIISLEILGSYHSVAGFINNIEQSGLMIEVQMLELEKVARDSNSLSGDLTLEITQRRTL